MLQAPEKFPPSMQHSQVITQKSASNLALAFILLPKPKREAMAVLYAFCREVDDVADEESHSVSERRDQLRSWREDIRRAFSNETPHFQVNREIQCILPRFPLSLSLFDELLDGVETDLEKTRYSDFEELDWYCYRVASVVGLLSIEIFGYSDPRVKEYAVHLGKALQYTNILRDVRNDAERGRIYLPSDVLVRAGVSPEEILNLEYSPRFAAAAAEVAARARSFYLQARNSLPVDERRTMVAAELMALVYWRILQKLEASQFDVFGKKVVRLSKVHKFSLILGWWLRSLAGRTVPLYGAE